MITILVKYSNKLKKKIDIMENIEINGIDPIEEINNEKLEVNEKIVK